MDAVICGIDPGLGTTGYGVIRACLGRVDVLDAGVCRFQRKQPLARRLVAVEQDISGILAEHSPTLLAVEKLYAHYRHPRTAILMAHARGVILVAAARLGVEVRGYEATRIKRYLTGNGRASKAQVQRAIMATLSLATPPDPPDVADALAIALCAAQDLSHGGRDSAEREAAIAAAIAPGPDSPGGGLAP